MIVLDTNVVSELMRPSPDTGVVGWLRSQSGEEIVTTAVTVAEIGYGIARLPGGRRRFTLETAARDIFEAFAQQVLSFDASAAQLYSVVVTQREAMGHPISGFDAQIASICRSRRGTLATRNVRDFTGTGIVLSNPWDRSAD